jgi:hypothetical protein
LGTLPMIKIQTTSRGRAAVTSPRLIGQIFMNSSWVWTCLEIGYNHIGDSGAEYLSKTKWPKLVKAYLCMLLATKITTTSVQSDVNPSVRLPGNSLKCSSYVQHSLYLRLKLHRGPRVQTSGQNGSSKFERT